MRKLSCQHLPALLAFAIACCLFALMPAMACADSATVLGGIINGFDHGGAGTLAATASGNAVDVRGGVDGASNQLILDINPGVEVIWNASYGGMRDDALIRLAGDGIFEIADGASIENNGAGGAVSSGGAGSNIRVSGGIAGGGAVAVETRGKVVMDGGAAYAYGDCVIYADGDVTVNGGTVNASYDATGVYSVKGNVYVNGNGSVSAIDGYAIRTEGKGARVELNGGVVMAFGGACIIVNGAGSKISITDGEVRAQSGVAIGVYGDNCAIEINSGSVSDIVGGIAVETTGKNSSVGISGGRISAGEKAALSVIGVWGVDNPLKTVDSCTEDN